MCEHFSDIFCRLCKYLVLLNVRTCLYFSDNVKLKFENMHLNYLQMVPKLKYSKKKIFNTRTFFCIFLIVLIYSSYFFSQRIYSEILVYNLFEFQKLVKVGSYPFFFQMLRLGSRLKLLKFSIFLFFFKICFPFCYE